VLGVGLGRQKACESAGCKGVPNMLRIAGGSAVVREGGFEPPKAYAIGS